MAAPLQIFGRDVDPSRECDPRSFSLMCEVAVKRSYARVRRRSNWDQNATVAA